MFDKIAGMNNMSKYLNRRSFLKLAGTLSLGAMMPPMMRNLRSDSDQGGLPNVIVVVFDALSAYHIPWYGYARNSMPNIAKLLDRAVVYHQHYSAGNFTTPGTASLLTGVLPWTHRALAHNAQVGTEFATKNIFSLFDDYYRMSYSHNRYVNTFFRQFHANIDQFVPREDLFIEDAKLFSSFVNDEDISSIGMTRTLNQKEEGYSYSLFLSRIYSFLQEIAERNLKKYRTNFPRGLPQINRLESFYILEQAIDYWIGTLQTASQPYLGYFHFLPPHNPYNTRTDFYNNFRGDGYLIPKKPTHVFSRNGSFEGLNRLNTYYDEFILYADEEFGRFYKSLQDSGKLENTWLILTSDHGELFERGVSGHSTQMLHQPIMRIPLVVFEPGRNSRLDITENTSAIDVLPTILKLTGHEIPAWIEGKTLPGLTASTNSGREILGVHSTATNDDEPIAQGSIMLVIDNYKLVYYFGYKELEESGDLIELFDIEADPLELENLSTTKKSIADEMVAIIQKKLRETNQPFL